MTYAELDQDLANRAGLAAGSLGKETVKAVWARLNVQDPRECQQPISATFLFSHDRDAYCKRYGVAPYTLANITLAQLKLHEFCGFQLSLAGYPFESLMVAG